MPYIASMGTYLPCWGSDESRLPGDDEDAITMAVQAGRSALRGGPPVAFVTLVSRDLPLLESSNAAVLLAGLGLDPELEVTERLGGAPAALDALSSARPRTLVIGVDVASAGAAAAVTAERGMLVRTAGRISRSLPVRTRGATGVVRDYGDPRLLAERGFLASLKASWVDTPVAVAGTGDVRSLGLNSSRSTRLPTTGASAGLFALAAMAESGTTGPLVGVEQATLSGISVDEGEVQIHRYEPNARATPERNCVPGLDIPISLAAYERAFNAKVRWEGGKFRDSDTVDFPPRYRVDERGALHTDYELVALPRTGTVYTDVTVEFPVPGLKTPYTLAIVELDGCEVRALVKVTGPDPGGVEIGDRGRMVLRRIAIRSGVPDYGYSFEPEPLDGERSGSEPKEAAACAE